MDFHFFGHGKVMEINVEKEGAPWIVLNSVLCILIVSLIKMLIGKQLSKCQFM